MRILPIENLRVPGEGSSARGKSGPKARPKGVVDGQMVEIPLPAIIVIYGVTREDRLTRPLVESGQAVRVFGRQIRQTISLGCDEDRSLVEK